MSEVGSVHGSRGRVDEDFRAKAGVLAALLEAQMESSDDGIIAVSPDGAVIALNDKFCELWGLGRDRISTGFSRSSPALEHVSNPQALLAEMEGAHREPGPGRRLEVQMADGRTIAGHSVAIRAEDDEYIGSMWFVHDEIERRAKLKVVFQGEASSARVARHELETALSDWGRDDMIDRAGLCVSEVVTNAVLHGGRPVELSAWLDERSLHVEIRDGRAIDGTFVDRIEAIHRISDPVEESDPELRDVDITGRGLLVLAEMSAEWGISTNQRGKTVWFVLWGEERSRSAERSSPEEAHVRDDDGPESRSARAAHEAPATHERWQAVKFLGVPIRLFVASRAHVHDLVRESKLSNADGNPVALRTVMGGVFSSETVIYTLSHLMGEGTTSWSNSRDFALSAGGVADIELRVPGDAVDHAPTLFGALDELENHCVCGEFLTIPASAELLEFQRWWITAGLDQIRGHSGPVVYPFVTGDAPTDP